MDTKAELVAKLTVGKASCMPRRDDKIDDLSTKARADLALAPSAVLGCLGLEADVSNCCVRLIKDPCNMVILQA